MISNNVKIFKKIGYGCGDLGISVSYFAIGFFFLFYLTDIVGMEPLLAGIVILIGKIWDGIIDPFIGILSDRTNSRFGRKRVYILFGTIPFAISFILLWMIPPSAEQWPQFLMATASLLFFTTTYSFITVPYMALVPVMTRNYDERTQITGIRAILSTLGTVMGGGIALMISSFTDVNLGLKTMAIGFSILIVLCLFTAAISVKGFEVNTGEIQPGTTIKLSRYLALLKEKNVLILLIFKFFGAIATGCLIASIPYFAEHVLHSTRSSSFSVGIYTLATALFIPVWNKLTNRYDKRRLLLIANISGAIVLIIISLVTTADYASVFLIGCGILGVIMSAYLLIPYSLVPDLVDFYQYKNGERHESVFFGLWMTVHQLGIAVAGFLLGAILSIGGYDGNAAAQTDSAILVVRLNFGLIPGFFLIVAAVILQKYGITRQVYMKVQEHLVYQEDKTK